MPPTPTPVYDTYWRFAAARQDVFFARIERPAGPRTDDPILARHKFTNAYRAADRVSQYLIRQVIYAGRQEPEEVFFRTLLFKIFNRIETWELLTSELDEIAWRSYRREHYDDVLTRAIEAGVTTFSAAYIMPSGGGAYRSPRKHRNYLSVLERMMADRLPLRLAQLPSLQDVFEAIRSYPLMGDFLAFQYAIDLNYGPLLSFDEDAFVVAGPGAVSGIAKCFSDTGGLSPAGVIRWVTDRQEEEFEKRGLRFRTLWGRRLHLIDCQNLFCETNKYARVAHPDACRGDGRTKIKQVFRPSAHPITYWFPPKWGINDAVARAAHELRSVTKPEAPQGSLPLTDAFESAP